MPAIAENRTILKDENGALQIVPEKGLVVIKCALLDQTGTPIQASAFSALTLTLEARDEAGQPIIDSLNDQNILNDGTYGVLGNNKTITGATNASPIVMTVTAHGYSSKDRITQYGVPGNRGANGTWFITVLDANTYELNGSVGTGVYTSGGTAVKGLHLTLSGTNNKIQNTANDLEWHRALIEGTFNGKPFKHEIDFPVRNLHQVS